MNEQPPSLLDIHAQQPLKHSGLGVASFVISLVTGFLMFAIVAVAGYVEMQTPGGMDEESPTAILIGLLVIGVGLLVLIGLGLGIAGWVQRERRRTFAVLGTIFNAVIVACTMGLVVLGNMAE